jgi:hypothetical protein
MRLPQEAILNRADKHQVTTAQFKLGRERAEADLLFRMVESDDGTIPAPKLNVVTVDQLFGVFLGGFTVRTNQFDCPEKAPVFADNICPILGHPRPAPTRLSQAQK